MRLTVLTLPAGTPWAAAGSLRSRAITLAAVLAVVAGDAGGTIAATTTGVRGVVMRGPIAPVCKAEQPCVAPAKKVVLHFVRQYSSGWTRTDLKGHYSIALAPGSYSLQIPSARFGYRPRVVTVRANRVAVLNITIDTGIR